MRLLLDTQVLLWWLDDRPMSLGARTAIADPINDVFVSAATAWEMSIKSSLGKRRAPDDLAAQLELSGFRSLPISIANALVAGALPRLHHDPFDRMLVAQALQENLSVVTRDSSFAGYAVELVDA